MVKLGLYDLEIKNYGSSEGYWYGIKLAKSCGIWIGGGIDQGLRDSKGAKNAGSWGGNGEMRDIKKEIIFYFYFFNIIFLLNFDYNLFFH